MEARRSKLYPWFLRPAPFALLLFLLFFVTLCISLWIAYVSHQETIQNTRRSNRSMADLVSRLIYQHQKTTLSILEAFANRPLVIQAAGKKDLEGILPHLKGLKSANPEIDSVFITDKNGVLWGNHPINRGIHGKDFSYREWYQKISEKWEPYVSGVFASAASPPVSVFVSCAPIRDVRGEVLGVLGTSMSLEKISQILKEIQPEKSTHILLIDQNRQIVYSCHLSFQNQILVYPENPIEQKLRQGIRGDDFIEDPFVKENMQYVSFSPVANIGWGVIIGIDRKDVLKEEIPQWLRIGIISGLAYLLILFSSFYFRRELVLKQTIKLLETAKELSERERRISSLMENIHMLGANLDGGGNIVYVNPFLLATTGYELKDLIGKNWIEIFIPEEQREKMLREYRETFERGDLPHYENAIRTRSGDERYILWNNTFNRDIQGKITSITTIGEDITERKKMELELRETVKALERSNKELTQFAYVASHDLQEPLRMVSSFTQLLAKRYKDKLDPEANEFIHFAVDGAVRMQKLIDDLLTYSRLESRGKPFAPVDLNLIIDRAMINLQMNIRSQEALITKDYMPIVLTDETQMVQLFQNLIGNSLKFHSQEPPRVHIGVKEQEDEWVFSVSDNGIGIDPQYFERIFKIFQRLHTRDEYPGTGIGLAICKRIIERHHGRIWVESKPGKGSVFFFALSKNPKNQAMEERA